MYLDLDQIGQFLFSYDDKDGTSRVPGISQTELQVPWLEPCMVGGLDDDAWNKSHRDGLDEQKVSLSVLEELNEPELSHGLDKLHRHPQS